VQEWHLAHGDFLDGAPPAHSIGMLNQCVNVVIKSLKLFHAKADIKNVMFEAMKFCAPCLAILQCPGAFGRGIGGLHEQARDAPPALCHA
jgi:hypothetical protein